MDDDVEAVEAGLELAGDEGGAALLPFNEVEDLVLAVVFIGKVDARVQANVDAARD